MRARVALQLALQNAGAPAFGREQMALNIQRAETAKRDDADDCENLMIVHHID
jgi:hypothetical protein